MHVPSYTFPPLTRFEQNDMPEKVSEEQVLAALKQGDRAPEEEGTVYIPGVSRLVAENIEPIKVRKIIETQVKKAGKQD